MQPGKVILRVCSFTPTSPHTTNQHKLILLKHIARGKKRKEAKERKKAGFKEVGAS
jgi:hypothetical protein